MIHMMLFGVIAQLGERLPCKQKVVSSILTNSISLEKLSEGKLNMGMYRFRQGYETYYFARVMT